MFGVGGKAGDVAVRDERMECALPCCEKFRRRRVALGFEIRPQIPLGRPMNVRHEFEPVAFQSVRMRVARAVVAHENERRRPRRQPMQAAGKIIRHRFVLAHEQTNRSALGVLMMRWSIVADMGQVG